MFRRNHIKYCSIKIADNERSLLISRFKPNHPLASAYPVRQSCLSRHLKTTHPAEGAPFARATSTSAEARNSSNFPHFSRLHPSRHQIRPLLKKDIVDVIGKTDPGMSIKIKSRIDTGSSQFLNFIVLLGADDDYA